MGIVKVFKPKLESTVNDLWPSNHMKIHFANEYINKILENYVTFRLLDSLPSIKCISRNRILIKNYRMFVLTSNFCLPTFPFNCKCK